MARELKSIDISNVPDLLRLVEELRKSGEPCVLTHEDEELATLRPIKASRRRRVKQRPFTENDPLWELVGSARSDGPGYGFLVLPSDSAS